MKFHRSSPYWSRQLVMMFVAVVYHGQSQFVPHAECGGRLHVQLSETTHYLESRSEAGQFALPTWLVYSAKRSVCTS